MIATQTLNPKVDAYLARAQPFAQPIMEYLRELVHKACPEIEETIKWSRPFFEYRGAILCNMSAFKEHCSFGFWGEEIGAVLREAGVAKGTEWERWVALPALPICLRQEDAGLAPPGRRFRRSGEYTSPIAARRKVVKRKTVS